MPDTLKNPILVLNCGSSSIKYALISDSSATRISGLAENLGLDSARIKHTALDGTKTDISLSTPHQPKADHTQALKTILESIKAYEPIAVGHRVVHGGREFSEAVKVTPHVLEEVKRLAVLAPLHNPAHALGIEAVLAIYPDMPQVVVFDTAFHHTMPPKAYRYAIPTELYNEHYIRRYGFHGTSHNYVSHRADTLAPSKNDTPNGWITAHLGNGCSLTAVYDGKSLDTSMGLTPLEGVVMGTRSGDIDPSVHVHLHRTLGYSFDEIDTILNKKSGLIALSELSSDMRAIEEAMADSTHEKHEQATLAHEIFCYKVARYIASLSCAVPVFTGIVFTGGIGENANLARQKILENLPHFGIVMDDVKNDSLVRGKEGSFHADNSRLQLWVIPTDEEVQILKETKMVLGL